MYIYVEDVLEKSWDEIKRDLDEKYKSIVEYTKERYTTIYGVKSGKDFDSDLIEKSKIYDREVEEYTKKHPYYAKFQIGGLRREKQSPDDMKGQYVDLSKRDQKQILADYKQLYPEDKDVEARIKADLKKCPKKDRNEKIKEIYVSLAKDVFGKEWVPAGVVLEAYQEITKFDPDKNLRFVLNEKHLKKDSAEIKALIEMAKRGLKEGKEVYVVISKPMIETSNSDVANYVYSDEELELINNLDATLKKLGMKQSLRFNQYSRKEMIGALESEFHWPLQYIIKANNEIDKVVKKILDSKLTPFEAMLYIHYYASQFKYISGEVEECRSIVGIYNYGKIVCSGYALISKSVIDKLKFKGYQGLECELVLCELVVDEDYVKRCAELGVQVKKVDWHCHNIVKIHDAEYATNGNYSNDATWDSKGKTGESRGFAHCLNPIDDLKHMRYREYKQNAETTRYSATMISNKYSDDLIVGVEDKGEPIACETFCKALINMWTKTGEVKDAYAKAAEEIEKSINRAGESFSNEAISNFVKLSIERQNKHLDNKSANKNNQAQQNANASQEIGPKSNLQQKISKFVQKVIAKAKHEDKEQHEDNTKKL